MNQNSSTDTSISSENGISAEAISRRAYEIWEREGRPEGNDLRHWLQAEQELGIRRSAMDSGENRDSTLRPIEINSPRNTGTDTRPLQGTRAAAAVNREPKRSSSATPFGQKSNGGGGQNSTKKKSANAPVM